MWSFGKVPFEIWIQHTFRNPSVKYFYSEKFNLFGSTSYLRLDFLVELLKHFLKFFFFLFDTLFTLRFSRNLFTTYKFLPSFFLLRNFSKLFKIHLLLKFKRKALNGRYFFAHHDFTKFFFWVFDAFPAVHSSQQNFFVLILRPTNQNRFDRSRDLDF